jgi:hypothetical protein
LWRYEKNLLTNFQYVDSTWRIIPTDSVKYYGSIHSGLVQYIMQDKNANIWFSTVGYPSLNCYDGKSFIQIETVNPATTHIFYMIEDTVGNIWCATRNNGVCCYNGKSFTWFNEKDGLLDNASCLLEDKNDKIWIGSVGKISDNGGRVTIYNGKKFIPFPVETLKHDNIWTMLEDNAGNIWFGTRDLGLYSYDGKSFTVFSE